MVKRSKDMVSYREQIGVTAPIGYQTAIQKTQKSPKNLITLQTLIQKI